MLAFVFLLVSVYKLENIVPTEEKKKIESVLWLAKVTPITNGRPLC